MDVFLNIFKDFQPSPLSIMVIGAIGAATALMLFKFTKAYRSVSAFIVGGTTGGIALGYIKFPSKLFAMGIFSFTNTAAVLAVVIISVITLLKVAEGTAEFFTEIKDVVN